MPAMPGPARVATSPLPILAATLAAPPMVPMTGMTQGVDTDRAVLKAVYACRPPQSVGLSA